MAALDADAWLTTQPVDVAAKETAAA